MLEHKPALEEDRGFDEEDQVLLDNIEFDSDDSDIDIERDSQVGVPRHLRLGKDLRNLRKSRLRYYGTITVAVIFWFAAVIGIGLLRTSGYVRNPFSNGGHYPSMPN